MEECPLCEIVDEYCEATGKPEECRLLVKAMMEGKMSPAEARKKLMEMVPPERLKEISERILQKTREQAEKAQG